MKKNFFVMIPFLVFIIMLVATLSVLAEEDPCREEGIVVKNLTMLDLWYKKNDSECTIWIHNHIIRIKPEDKADIFSDMICRTSYCKANPTYKGYKSLDKNRNCRVRILPRCNLSDM
jgi:hypothetical protein